MNSGLKHGLIALLVLLPLMAAAAAFGQYRAPVNPEKLNPTHNYLVRSIHQKWQRYYETVDEPEIYLVSYGELTSLLNPFQQSLVSRIYPADALEQMQAETERRAFDSSETIPWRSLPGGGHFESIGTQYLSAEAIAAFGSMMEAMESVTGDRLYICSSYRSAGRQAFLAIRYFSRYNSKSLRRMSNLIAFPGKSEHNDPTNPAVDLCNENGFFKSQGRMRPAFRWMMRNAGGYGFTLTYPRNNNKGKQFEPWHWRFTGIAE